MSRSLLTGSRIRQVRLDNGMKQSALADAIRVSGSYLNLIEHNRRRIGGRLLQDIAQALGVDVSSLLEEAATSLIDGLRLAAGNGGVGQSDLSRVAEFAGRFPGWAKLVTDQAQTIDRLREQLDALSDRLSHDPALAASMHEVLSAAASIRSTSSILVENTDLDRAWQERFLVNVDQDSRRLTNASRSLVNYLDAPRDKGYVSTIEEVDRWFQSRNGHVPELEQGGNPADVLAGSELQSAAAKALLGRRLETYAKDAAAAPLGTLRTLMRASHWDPSTLAAEMSMSLPQIFRRLASLPNDRDFPQFGLVVVDRSGTFLRLQSVPGLALLRNGACPIWPVFRALGQPDQAIREAVEMPGQLPARYMTYTVCETKPATGFGLPAEVTAIMLIEPSTATFSAPTLLGSGCRLCSREACALRREESLLSEPGGSALL